MLEIMRGETSATQNAAFLAALSTKSAKAETIDEISGCATAMRSLATPVEHPGMEVLEIVGTGGDGAHRARGAGKYGRQRLHRADPDGVAKRHLFEPLHRRPLTGDEHGGQAVRRRLDEQHEDGERGDEPQSGQRRELGDHRSAAPSASATRACWSGVICG